MPSPVGKSARQLWTNIYTDHKYSKHLNFLNNGTMQLLIYIHTHTNYNCDRKVTNNFVGGKKHALMFMDQSESLKKKRLKMWCDNENYLMVNFYIIRNYSNECQFQYRITKRAAHFSEVYLLNNV
jgi:hypothetical protein